MSLHDLPDDWPRKSLSDSLLARDVVDLCLTRTDRAGDSLLVVLCDSHARTMAEPLVIGGVPWHCPERERHIHLRNIARIPAGSMLFAVSSADELPPRVAQAWCRTARSVLDANGKALVGFFSACLDGVLPVHLPAADHPARTVTTRSGSRT